jgi:hypothetical protein
MSASDYVVFAAMFAVTHTVVYHLAGFIALRLARDAYTSKTALYRYSFRDLEDPWEARRIGLVLIPVQLFRGVLMAAVLFPLLGTLDDFSYGVRAAILGGLMFVYADFASAVPFSNTIEGLVYLKREFVARSIFLRIQAEAVMYSVAFGCLAAWLAFLWI